MKEKYIKHIQDMQEGQEHHCGTALVHKKGSLYRLYKIPLHGYEPMFLGNYSYEDIPILADEVWSWFGGDNWISVQDSYPTEPQRVRVKVNNIVSDVEAYAYICPEYGNTIWETLEGEDYPAIVTHWQSIN